MAQLYIPDLDDTRRAQAIVGDYTRTRLEIIAARPGNPTGAEVRRFDGAVALRAPGFPGPGFFNRAYGFCDAHIEHIPALIDWYAAGVGGAFDISPGRPVAQTTRLLADAGYALSGFHATTVGLLDLPSAPAPGVEVVRIEDEVTLEAFSDVYHRAWGITGPGIPMKGWLTAPGWMLYLATFEGRPAGAAVQYIVGGDAYLADGAVDPDFRRHGVHRALLDRRCDDAKAAGATRVYCGCDYLSPSYRNQMRKGLTLLYTEANFVSPQRAS
jgi:GNAT superfamily N-acetyltransferase